MNLDLLPEALREKHGEVYFLGIGGSGMYGVACLASCMGFSVCGADGREGKNTSRLRARGIRLYSEEEMLPPSVSLVVYSLAVGQMHPRLQEAKARGIPVYSRPDFFGRLMRAYPCRIAVAGSHGKSSTTAMCAEILSVAGRSPTVLSGADLGHGKDSFLLGAGDILLFEACEYRDAFLSFCPTHALALDVSWEHTDYFPDKESVLHSFDAFLHGGDVEVSVAPYGVLSATVTFGKGGMFTAENVVTGEEGSHFSLCREGKVLGNIDLPVLGAFQVENALGAAALAHTLHVKTEDIVCGLSRFRGIPRRMEMRGSLRGVPLYLDFAHHPKELFCALRTASLFGRPLAVVFEPHTYSRTKTFFDEYVRALRMPHIAGVLPIYAARETETLGVSSVLLAKEAGVAFLSDYVHAARFLTRAAGKGCTLLLVGAGGVEEVLSHLPFLFPAAR